VIQELLLNIQKINLVGPREPSGITWLANCLIEIGLRVEMPEVQLWKSASSNSFRFNQDFRYLARMMPSLANPHREFTFQESAFVEMSHNWISENVTPHRTILFTRDPRTSMYSNYLRKRRTDESFQSFVSALDHKWLLDRLQIWNLWHILWALHDNILVVKFEDYKMRPRETLLKILSWINFVDFDEEKLQATLKISDWRNASETEAHILTSEKIKGDLKLSRSSSMEMENYEVERETYLLIERTCSKVYQGITEKKDTVFSYLNSDHFFAIREKRNDLYSMLNKKLGYKQQDKYDLRIFQTVRSESLQKLKEENYKAYLVYLQKYGRRILEDLHSDLTYMRGKTISIRIMLPFFLMTARLARLVFLIRSFINRISKNWNFCIFKRQFERKEKLT
jgi:hypothetical protein